MILDLNSNQSKKSDLIFLNLIYSFLNLYKHSSFSTWELYLCKHSFENIYKAKVFQYLNMEALNIFKYFLSHEFK